MLNCDNLLSYSSHLGQLAWSPESTHGLCLSGVTKKQWHAHIKQTKQKLDLFYYCVKASWFHFNIQLFLPCLNKKEINLFKILFILLILVNSPPADKVFLCPVPQFLTRQIWQNLNLIIFYSISNCFSLSCYSIHIMHILLYVYV